ncbi:YgaP family membrane protein [Algoriphagus halophilus]|uniref:Inner membrane protein YgaP-like transmembrane domain-containing protein n=1 Tax=Algoriphagus halophilus TaxID=226505 RepID=A0A1N6DBA5_9BACT|nr:DUF2892 domain-containing protein [Algoriphagus halophilus]SIN68027.1 Protein of unknown function [Algoriphagus halophilus]
MKKNMGTIDRAIRLVVAAVLVLLYFSGIVSGTLGIISLVVALIFAITSLVSYCPLYAIVGIKTCHHHSVK